MKIEDLLRINHKPETLEQCWALIDPLVHACVALNELVADLKEKVEHQEEKLKINSKNSSLPPSKDLQKKRPSSPQAADLVVANSVTKAIRELYYR
jgi:transposase